MWCTALQLLTDMRYINLMVIVHYYYQNIGYSDNML